MPLTYIQDFCGAITRTTEDQALVLNAIAARDPGNTPRDSRERAGKVEFRPTGAPTSKTDALEGKTSVGEPESLDQPWGDRGTINAIEEEFKFFEAAGATVNSSASADGEQNPRSTSKGHTGYEGWLKWIQDHPNSPYKSPPEITLSQLRFRSCAPPPPRTIRRRRG